MLHGIVGTWEDGENSGVVMSGCLETTERGMDSNLGTTCEAHVKETSLPDDQLKPYYRLALWEICVLLPFAVLHNWMPVRTVGCRFLVSIPEISCSICLDY
jgi:hypothetical protein